MGIIPAVLTVVIVTTLIVGMIWAVRTGKEKAMSKRSAVWGSLITGIAGWMLAINSMMDGEGIGAGLCLLASAAAFGVMALLAIKE